MVTVVMNEICVPSILSFKLDRPGEILTRFYPQKCGSNHWNPVVTILENELNDHCIRQVHHPVGYFGIPCLYADTINGNGSIFYTH